MPHIRARPITMERFPSGIGKKGFIQKDVSKGFPSWLERVEAPKKDGVVHHPLVTDTRSLLWIANQNTITPHVWSARAPDLYSPDICVFDLDPSIDDADSLRGGRAGASRAPREARASELGEDIRLQGLSHRRSRWMARPTQARSSRFAHTRRPSARRARARSPDAGVQQGRSRHGGFYVDTGATTTARRGRRRTRRAPSPARQCRHRARGRRSSAAPSVRGPSRCRRCRRGWRGG